MKNRGSALLIVLGMLAFMLFSGLAFSVYMRQTRMPTSFLRRTSITRQLAKAALAEAIADIDAAIAYDPHPGVGDKAAHRRGLYNSWNHRVFFGSQWSNNIPTMGTEDDIVPTLSLEGVAYIPPPLINEVRYYSQHTPTAEWKHFRFDAGRYAYTAVDVSDYFDINKVIASRPRSSAGNKRVTLAHVFEESNGSKLHTSADSGEAKKWDEWMAKMRKVDQNTDAITYSANAPLVSMADFNLALGNQTFGEIESPFVSFIESKTGKDGFYPNVGDSESDAAAEAYRSMTFVTDSYLPTTTTTTSQNGNSSTSTTASNKKSLGDERYQPFDRDSLKKDKSGQISFDEVTNCTGERQPYTNFLGNPGLIALFDYLDEDSVPFSLAVPTTEKVPMICGIKFNVEQGQLQIMKVKEATQSAQGQEEEQTITYCYSINGGELGNLLTREISVLTMYPFLHGENTGNFKINGRFAIFLTNGDTVGLRLENEDDNSPFALKKNFASGNAEVKDNVLIVPFKQDVSVSIPKTISKIEDAITSVSVRPTGVTQLNDLINAQSGREKALFWITQQKDGAVQEVGGKMLPINAQGTALNQNELSAMINNGTLTVNIAVWLQVVDGDNKVVDLVPARLKDDDELNGASNYQSERGRAISRSSLGTGMPLMKFKLGEIQGAQIPVGANGGTINVALNQSLKISDPRFNHEPESWTLGEANANSWNSVNSGDIFMSVSNQGYLQSVYELSMLLRLNDPGQSQGRFGSYSAPKGKTQFDSEALNSSLMWKSYWPYARNQGQDDSGNFDNLKEQLDSAATGLRVNPYSDSVSVMMATFANTPHDWSVASTNDNSEVSPNYAAGEEVGEFNKQYAWNSYSTDSNGQLKWEELEEVAESFIDEVRNNQNWVTAYNNLWKNDSGNGGDQTKRLMGVDLEQSSKLYEVDKKFLYGFWRECFAAKQQLFLIFVRAEPMMMGGGVASMAPPQLGTKAVALVWRDPNATNGQNYPHRTRVLFYHPLD